LTGRPTTRAASAVRITCGQARSAAPENRLRGTEQEPGRASQVARTPLPGLCAYSSGLDSCRATVSRFSFPAGHRGEEPHRIVGHRRRGEDLVIGHLGGGECGGDITAIDVEGPTDRARPGHGDRRDSAPEQPLRSRSRPVAPAAAACSPPFRATTTAAIWPRYRNPVVLQRGGCRRGVDSGRRFPPREQVHFSCVITARTPGRGLRLRHVRCP